MLIMFRTKNFASFKDDVILDLRKTSYKQHPTHTFKIDEIELLKTVAIYGANASGKSNLIRAIYEFERFIISQFFEDNEDTVDTNKKRITMVPFLLTNDINNEIEFEIVFHHKGSLYQYGYTVGNNKILSEWLLVNNEEVFYRKKDNDEILFGENYEDILKYYSKYRKDRLYISTLDYFATDDKIKCIIEDLKEYLGKKFNIYTEIIFETSIKSDINTFMLEQDIIHNENLRNKVSEYIRKIDVGIEEIIIEKEIIKSSIFEEEKEIFVPKTLHYIYDEDNNVIDKKVFDISQESSGTIRFLSFIQHVIKLVEDGGVFIVDELSSRLHPLLTKFIVDIFQSDINKKNAQLIFTTHEASIMNKEQFRRDEVVIVDKDNNGKSSLCALSDLKIREDATFNKDYFRGKYGGIPIIEECFIKR